MPISIIGYLFEYPRKEFRPDGLKVQVGWTFLL